MTPPEKWYAAFFYTERRRPDTPDDFFRRIEVIVLPPTHEDPRATVFFRNRRSALHRPVWKRSDSTDPVNKAIDSLNYEIQRGSTLKRPVVVPVHMLDVKMTVMGTAKDKSPYYVINKVRRILLKRGEIA